MSKKKRKNRKQLSSDKIESGSIASVSNQNASDEAIPVNRSKGSGWIVYLRSHLWMVAVIVFLSLGALGAGLKYLDEDAQRQNAKGLSDEKLSLLSRVNPFVPNPSPTPTPPLSKEYIYAGSKLLAVEDVNANAAPPSDLAIWRPGTGEWWILNGQTLQYYAFAWGNGSIDSAQPGDYDGDGKTDFCIFRSTTNEWWIVKSSDYTHYVVAFGQTGDKLAPADYDGDGKTDVAVYRTGTWLIHQSSNGVTIDPPFGLPDDLPAPKDFDGDGKADLAVWRNSDKTFYSHNSSNNTSQTATFEQTSTKPVPGDYDGDGKADHAIRNGANWIIKQSSNSQIVTINWHQDANDTEVQNDYDGDGKVDIAIWKNSDGNWYIRQSSKVGQSSELRQVAWGSSGDKPVPAYYRW